MLKDKFKFYVKSYQPERVFLAERSFIGDIYVVRLDKPNQMSHGTHDAKDVEKFIKDGAWVIIEEMVSTPRTRATISKEIIDYEKKIYELQKEYASFKYPSMERVEKSDGYFYVGTQMDIGCLADNRCGFDNLQFESGNYFTEEEHAAKFADMFRLMLLAERFAIANDAVSDWGNDEVYKYVIVQDGDKLTYMSWKALNHVSAISFSKADVAEKFIEKYKDLIEKVLK